MYFIGFLGFWDKCDLSFEPPKDLQMTSSDLWTLKITLLPNPPFACNTTFYIYNIFYFDAESIALIRFEFGATIPPNNLKSEKTTVDTELIALIIDLSLGLPNDLKRHLSDHKWPENITISKSLLGHEICLYIGVMLSRLHSSNLSLEPTNDLQETSSVL